MATGSGGGRARKTAARGKSAGAANSKNPTGWMLSGEGLLDALDHERIFREGSWEPSRIKGAGYELRLAGDWGSYPSADGGVRSVRRASDADGGGVRGEEFDFLTLEPGQSAIVASIEKFCLDFDITCQIGPKFRWAAEGVQLLHGAVAHPGYGMHKDAVEGWVKKTDERLYVVIVNIGPESVTLTVGKPIAYVQFFAVDRVEPESDIENPALPALESRLEVAYYRVLQDHGKALDGMGKRLEIAERLVDSNRWAVEFVVIFGMFLVTTALLGIAYNGVATAVSSIPEHASDAQLNLIRVLTVAFAALCVVPLGLAVVAVRALLNRPPTGGDGG